MRRGAQQEVLHGQALQHHRGARSRSRSRRAASRPARPRACAPRRSCPGCCAAYATRSPTANCVTPAPTASITPAPSLAEHQRQRRRVQAGAEVDVDEVDADRVVADRGPRRRPVRRTGRSTSCITSGPPCVRSGSRASARQLAVNSRRGRPIVSSPAEPGSSARTSSTTCIGRGSPRRRARQLLDRQAREPRALARQRTRSTSSCATSRTASSRRSRRSRASTARSTRIVHLAAQVSVVHRSQNPLVDMQVNYGGTLHVLEYARAHGVKKVVFASSAAVYGDVAELPVARGRAVPAGVAVRHRQARLRARARLLRDRARRARRPRCGSSTSTGRARIRRARTPA